MDPDKSTRLNSRTARQAAVWSAKIEAYLSTHGFEILFLVFYYCASLLMFIWGFRTQWVMTENRTMRWFISIARGAGYILNLNTSLVVLLAARISFTWIRETPLKYILPLDKAFPAFHMLVGYTIAGTVVVHAVFHMVWICVYNGWNSGLWGFTMTVVTGFLLLLVFIVMLVMSRPRIRRERFRLFYLIHVTGALLFCTILIFHGMYNERPETYKWLVPSLVVYIADRIIRRLRISCFVLQLSAENSFFKRSDIFVIRVPKPFKFRAGQYAELMVPSISNEWHPFTIASSPHEETMSFFIKGLGNWTVALRDIFASLQEREKPHSLKVRIRGPYGAPCQQVDSFERVVLISGGVGATPFSAICKDLHHQNTVAQAQVDEAERCSTGNLGEIDKRIQATLSDLYTVDIENIRIAEDAEVQESFFVADTHRLSLENPTSRPRQTQRREASSSDTQKSDSESGEKTSFSSESSMSSFLTAVNEPILQKEQIQKWNAFRKNSSLGRGATTSARRGLDENNTSLNDSPTSGSENTQARPPATQLLERRFRLLSFLHTTRVHLILLLSVVARLVIISVGSILDSAYISLRDSDDNAYLGTWVIAIDTSLSFFTSIILPLTIFLEISVMGFQFFRTPVRCFDFFVLIPLTLLCTALGIRKWVLQDPGSIAIKASHYVLFTPFLFIYLCFRMYRSIGSRSWLDSSSCNCTKYRATPEVDFIWTVPYEDSDRWLRDELSPLTTGSDLRLHRYVTREQEEDLEAAEPLVTSASGRRPQWDIIFRKIAEQAPSDSSIGIFFCGPHSMGHQIRAAVRKVEVVSNLRGAYLRGTPRTTLMKDLGLKNPQLVDLLRSSGCSVRFVFREENFG